MTTELHPKTQEIASRLTESEPGPLAQISRAIQVLGLEQIEAALAEAERIEAEGGLSTADGINQHTLGGIFFRHLRKTASRAEWQLIRKENKDEALGPVQPALEWSERASAVEEARANRGVIAEVVVSAVGTTQSVKRQGDDYLVITMDSNGDLPPISSELPRPESVASSFRVVLSKGHWRRLQGAMQNPLVDLVASGYPIPNVKQRSVVLFSLTANLQTRPDDEEIPVPVTRVRLVGKPGQVVQRGATVVMAFESTQAPKKFHSEFSDLPNRTVTYIVYASERQWRKAVNVEDVASRSLSLNGVCFYDPDLENLAILTQNLNLAS